MDQTVGVQYPLGDELLDRARRFEGRVELQLRIRPQQALIELALGRAP